MDIQMPEMDRIDATREIRKLWPQGPKIIVITVLDRDLCNKQCIDAVADDFLSKTQRKEELHAAIERNMGETCVRSQ